DEAIADAVRRQEEIGLRAVTDGEIRRRTWHMDFYYQIGGLAKVEETVEVPFQNEAGALPFQIEGVRAAGKLRLDRTIFGEDFTYLKSVAHAVPKLTIPSPSVMHRRGGQLLDHTNPTVAKLYPDMDAFWPDLIAVYRAELAALAQLGCTYLQIDDTSWASLCDPGQRRAMDRLGSDG
ncbi:MAG: hypothetical protein ACREFQ_13775, partial [Stellaceae bacterium]